MRKDKAGLSEKEAKKRLQIYGSNVLPEKPPPSAIIVFLSQLKNPLVYILLAASLITFFLRELADTFIILVAVFINTILGFVQEERANKALYSLKKLIEPHAKVIRSKMLKELPVEMIVPGDLVILEQGMKIPADGRLINANRFFVSEAVLTGESVPVQKSAGKDVFMGTIVTSGRGEMIVEKTGRNTEIGKIALDIQKEKEDTPLKKQLSIFSRQLTILVVILISFVFLIGVLRDKEISELFTTSVALAVSAIPEGLLVGLTVVLAIGMQRILKKKGLVRNLVSAETLGGVTTICVDKTGTLTKGKMQVVEVYGDEEGLKKQAILANDLDDPLVIAAWEWAVKKQKASPGKLRKLYPRIDSIPFSSKSRFFASLNKDQKTSTLFVNGAPEYLLSWSKISSQKKEKTEEKIKKLTQSGYRVIGFARRTNLNFKSISENDVKKDLEFIGLLAFSDPVRPQVEKALEKTQKAGIKVLVITGDYPETAMSVMKRIGLDVDIQTTITGSKLANISPRELQKKLKNNEVKLFARTTPDQKLKIVEALKNNGEVVAVMGDGVNDAPALNESDIGIVVGNATDVAKETADLVLLDSNFATIVEAIEEGRGIFDNIRKIILYLMSDAFEEIIAVIAAIIFALSLPVTAVQILWINLVSDGLPNLALTIDPKSPGIMNRPPRSPQENVVSAWMRELIVIVSLAGGLVAFLLFYITIIKTNNIALARSIAFATLGVNSLVYVYSVRTLRNPFWKENAFSNKWLNISVIAGLILQFIPFSTQSLRHFFELEQLSPLHLALIFSSSLFMFIIIELGKIYFRFKKI